MGPFLEDLSLHQSRLWLAALCLKTNKIAHILTINTYTILCKAEKEAHKACLHTLEFSLLLNLPFLLCDKSIRNKVRGATLHAQKKWFKYYYKQIF